MDLLLQIGVAVYHLAKLRMLDFYCNFIDKYIDRSDFELLEMDTDSNYFAFSEDSVEELIKPHMREEYEKNKYMFLTSESTKLHPTFKVDEHLHMHNMIKGRLIHSKKKRQLIK
jgi:hypothetical protein